MGGGLIMNISRIEKELFQTIKKALEYGLEKKDYYYWRAILNYLYSDNIKYNSPEHIVIDAIEQLLGLINESGIMHRFSKENIDYIVENSYLLPLVMTNNNYEKIKLDFANSYIFKCQFHNDKKPSFSVTDYKNLAHCFGCGKSVNVISYLKQIEHLTFTESIELLANIYMFDIKNYGHKFKELSEKYKDTILSAEYKQLLEKGYNRLMKKNDLSIEEIDNLYKKRFEMIDRVRNNTYDSNFIYKENPKTIKLTLSQIK